MSSDLYESYNTIDVKSVRYSVVSAIQEELAEFVRIRMRELRLSYADVANRSKGEITHGTVWNIVNNRVKEIKQSTLRALAVGLGVPEEELFSRARIVSPKDEAGFQESIYYSLYEKTRSAPPDTQDFINRILRMVSRELDSVVMPDGIGTQEKITRRLLITSPVSTVGNEPERRKKKR